MPTESSLPGSSSPAQAADPIGDLSARVRELEEELLTAHQEIGRTRTLITRAVILQSSPDSYFHVDFNGAAAWIPAATLRTMIHCVHGGDTIRVRVEIAHLEWMLSRMAPGGVFVDIGASTGAITIPMVSRFASSDAQIIAFEPARSARRLLSETLEVNALRGVEIVAMAVSNEPGTATFCEFDYDETVNPFLPETSALYSSVVAEAGATQHPVEVTTLDNFFAERPLGSPVVVKIDVEGFEGRVLEGAAKFIGQHRPYFSIDIHRDPFGEGTTETQIRAFLAARNYRFTEMAHVLLASPAETGDDSERDDATVLAAGQQAPANAPKPDAGQPPAGQWPGRLRKISDAADPPDPAAPGPAPIAPAAELDVARDKIAILPGCVYARYALPVDYLPSRDLRPRWGNTHPPIAVLHEWFGAHAPQYEAFLDEMARSLPNLAAIPRDFDESQLPEPAWFGVPFAPFDSVALYTMVRVLKPRTYLEIGSGITTCFAAKAVRDHNLATRIISIDPEPRTTIDALCDEVIRDGLETCNLDRFDMLEPGDIVFFDGSHRSFMNSDVTVFMIDVLPRLKPGVVVHIHDINLPWDYPDMFVDWYWNEQYLLAVYLMAARSRLDPILPTAFICRDERFAARLAQPLLDFGDEFLNSGWRGGGSMWFTHKAETQIMGFSQPEEAEEAGQSSDDLLAKFDGAPPDGDEVRGRGLY